MKDLQVWIRSSFCEAGACLEAFGPWRKTSYSSESFNCVEARRPEDNLVLVRDSKLGDDSPVLSFDARSWAEFVDGLKGEGS